jgi:hypothetical protein
VRAIHDDARGRRCVELGEIRTDQDHPGTGGREGVDVLRTGEEAELIRGRAFERRDPRHRDRPIAMQRSADEGRDGVGGERASSLTAGRPLPLVGFVHRAGGGFTPVGA